MGVKIIIGRADTHRFSNAVIGHLAPGYLPPIKVTV